MIAENRINAPIVPLPGEIRYSDSVMAATMDMVYLPPLTRCGKTLRVSR